MKAVEPSFPSWGTSRLGVCGTAQQASPGMGLRVVPNGGQVGYSQTDG